MYKPSLYMWGSGKGGRLWTICCLALHFCSKLFPWLEPMTCHGSNPLLPGHMATTLSLCQGFTLGTKIFSNIQYNFKLPDFPAIISSLDICMFVCLCYILQSTMISPHLPSGFCFVYDIAIFTD